MKTAVVCSITTNRNMSSSASKSLSGCSDSLDVDTLFSQYKDYVYSVALYLCHHPVVAEDLTQTVFLKVLKNKQQFRKEAEIKTWLYRIVFNAYIDITRANRNFVPLEITEELERELSSYETPDTEMLHREMRIQIRKAVQLLTPKLRVPLILRYVAGLSYAEIANVLKTTTGTVASRISRAHAQLSERLENKKGIR